MEAGDLVAMWPTPQEETVEISLDNIEASPTNPRQSFPEDHIRSLADNIREQGLIQPITVRPLYSITAKLSDGSHTFAIASCEGAQKWLQEMSAQLEERSVETVTIGSSPSQYEIVAGECRWRAYKLLQQSDGRRFGSILCLVRQLGDEQVREIQLSENTHRKDLSPLELARTYQELVEIERGKKTQDPMQVVAKRLGVNKSVIAQTIQTTKAIPEVLRAMEMELITKSHAIDAARLPAEQQMEYLCECLLGYYSEEEVRVGLDDSSARDEFQTASVASMKAWTKRELDKASAKNNDALLLGDSESEPEGDAEDDLPASPAVESGVCTECGVMSVDGIMPIGVNWANDAHTLCSSCADAAKEPGTRLNPGDTAANKKAQQDQEKERREREIKAEVARQAVGKILKAIADTAGKCRQAMNADDLVDVGIGFFYNLPDEQRDMVASELGIATGDVSEYLRGCNVSRRGLFLVLCSLGGALATGPGGQIFDSYAVRYKVDLNKIEFKARAAREKAAKKDGRK
jgi:ParB/RepB/Spo0J family partition protein